MGNACARRSCLKGKPSCFKCSPGCFKCSPGCFKCSPGCFKCSPRCFKCSPSCFKCSPSCFKCSLSCCKGTPSCCKGTPSCLKCGCCRSISCSSCFPRPRWPQKIHRRKRETDKHSKDSLPIQNTPPKPMTISKEDPMQEDPMQVDPMQDVKVQRRLDIQEEPKPSKRVSMVKQQSKHMSQRVSSVRNPQNMKRVVSAGLQADRVLKNQNGNLNDHFILGKKLGNGQFGTTFLCTEKATAKQFACKSIAKRKLLMDDDVEDVRREIEIMHHLSGHPNVVSIKEAYEDAASVYLIMELCSGGELFDRITQRGHYSERQAADLARTIIRVVEACHSMGVMHRDLKPENFLFVDENEDSPMKAIDFGLSIFFKPGETFTDVVGSPYYVAPEVLQKLYGPEADIWSAGVIFYILLCGVPPFWGETEGEIFEEILNGELDFTIDPWPELSESAKDLVTKMLVRDREKRITAHEVLCHPWISVDGVAPDKPLDSAVVTRLNQFSAMNRLKKLALRVIATKLSEEEIAGLKQMFKTIDTDNSGHITFEELKEGLKNFGANLDELEMYDLMQAADIDNSGTIDYEEFVAATLHFNKIDKQERLYAAFSYFDKDGSGYITVNEIQQSCKELGIDDGQVEEIIKEADQNNDGRIDYNEFVTVMQMGVNTGRRQMKNTFNF